MASIYIEGVYPKNCMQGACTGPKVVRVARRKLASRRKLKSRMRHDWTPHILFDYWSRVLTPSCSHTLYISTTFPGRVLAEIEFEPGASDT